MPRHREVLIPITDEKAQFVRCKHLTHLTLETQEGRLYLVQQAFTATDSPPDQPDSKVERESPPIFLENKPGQPPRRLTGDEAAQALKRLTETDKHKTETELYAQVSPDHTIRLGGASISLALYTHRTTGELWVGKSDVGDGGVLSTVAVLRERVANDIYAYYGVPVPRLAVAQLPCCYRTADNQRMYAEEDGITQATHLMSRWLDRFNPYPEMPKFKPDSNGPPPDKSTLVIDDQLVPERGLGHVLAVAHFVHDVDVTNAAGKNIGYRLRADPQGPLTAQTCKIDPGYAFHDVEDKNSPAYRVTQAMPFATQHREQDYIPFSRFPLSTQREFIATLTDIVDTPTQDIALFFNRQGLEALKAKGFADNVVPFLQARQQGLAKAFAKELAAYRATQKKVPENTEHQDQQEDKSIMILPEDLQPLYAHAQLEQNTPIFRQARHFYLEPGTTLFGQSDEKPEPLKRRLSDFLAHSEQRVLLLQGDSGFGKSTATQILTQQQWAVYRQNPSQARVPLRLELKHFTDRTVGRCVDNALTDEYHLSPTQIQILKQRPTLVILDGYDEIGGRAHVNLWNSHGLSQWRNVKLIVTCRTLYLDESDLPRHFYPENRAAGFVRYYLAPFSVAQIETYLRRAFESDSQTIEETQETKKRKEIKEEKEKPSLSSALLKPKKRKSEQELKEQKKSKAPQRKETAEDSFSNQPPCLSRLDTVSLSALLAPSSTLPELLQVPLMLKIFTDALPTLQRQGEDFRNLNRFVLYQAFMRQWFERNRVRLSENLGQLVSESVCEDFLRYSENLALALHKAQQVEVDYAPGVAPWDAFFTRQDETAIRLRSGCPLRRSGDRYSFIHKSFLEFFVAQHLFHHAVSEDTALESLIERLGYRRLSEEPQILAFLAQAQQAQKNSTPHDRLTRRLRAVIERSKQAPEIALSSANAATLLNRCGTELTGQSWRGVQLPGADLSYVLLAHSDLRGANLRGATLIHTVLYGANLSGADLRDVNWGEQPRLELKQKVGAIATHPTEPWLAAAQGNEIWLIHRESGERIGSPLAGHRLDVNSVAFSPNGRLIASGSWDQTVRLWETSSQRPVGSPLAGHTREVASVAFSPDGRLIASGSDDKTVRLWETSSQRPFGSPLAGHTNGVNSVAFSPDGRLIASGSEDKTVRLWETSSQRPFGSPLAGHRYRVTSVAFSPDGQLIVSGSWDKTVRLWETSSQRPVGSPLAGHTSHVTSVAFSPDGRLIASGSGDKTVRLWETSSQRPVGSPLAGHTSWVVSVAFSPDGRLIASGSGDKTVRLWETSSQRPVGSPLAGHTESVRSVAFSPDGRLIASGSWDQTVRLWETSGQRPVGSSLAGHTSIVTSVAFSPDGRLIASGSADQTVRLWETSSQRPVGSPLAGHTSIVTSVAFSPDGRLIASGSQDHTVRLWEASSQRRVGSPLAGHSWSVMSVVFSPDGRLIASGSEDKTVRLWETSSQRPFGSPLAGHTSIVTSVAFSPDGRLIASGSDDKTVRLWETSRQRPVGAPLAGHTGTVRSVAFSPDSRLIASGSEDKTVRLWETATGRSLSVVRWTSSLHSVAFVPPPSTVEGNKTRDEKSRSRPSEEEKLPEENEAKGHRLVVGDGSGMLSLWSVSPEDGNVRLIGMPKHLNLPMYAESAEWKGCRMSAQTRRLLQQNGASVDGVVVDDEEQKKSKEPKEREEKITVLQDEPSLPHSPSTHERHSKKNSERQERSERTAPKEPREPKEPQESKELKTPVSLLDMPPLDSDQDRVSRRTISPSRRTPSPSELSSPSSTREEQKPPPRPSTPSLPLPPQTSIAQRLSQQGVTSGGAQQAQQCLGQAVLALVAAMETQRQSDWDPHAHLSFTGTVVGVLMKNQWDDFCANPKLYSIPKTLGAFIQQHVQQYPLLRDLSAHPDFARSLKSALSRGQLAELRTRFNPSRTQSLQESTYAPTS